MRVSTSATERVRAGALDAAVPTAVEALERKREAMAVLRDIDALLRTDSETRVRADHGGNALTHTRTNCGADGRRGRFGTPGPGSYNPETRSVYKQERCSAKFEACAGRNHPPLPWKRRKPASCTPGPGAYATASADILTKPRVLSASIRPSASTCSSSMVLSGSSDAAATLHVAATVSPPTTSLRSSYVAYKLPTAPSYRTREQKLKVRSILAARRRWATIEFYDIKHAVVERRLGATCIVPMARQAASSASKPHPAQLRRKLRLWRRSGIEQSPGVASTNSGTKVDKDAKAASRCHGKEREREAFRKTEQWKRARARKLVRATERKLRVQEPRSQEHQVTRTELRALPAHAMSKQIGRDVVTCRQRAQRVVSSFGAAVRKERVKPQREPSSSPPPTSAKVRRAPPGREPFALTTGRDDSLVDALGMHILGTEAEQRSEAVLRLDASDAATRPKPTSAIISPPPGDDERFPLTAKQAKELAARSELEPKFDTVDPSVRGHRYVRFDRQLDRPAFVAPASFDDEQLVLPSAFPILDELKFPAPRGGVSYARMQGREDVESVGQYRPLDAVYEVRDSLMAARVRAPVDMDRMMSRAATEPLDDDELKDAVLCKLRASDGEVASAMRLLSTVRRSDVGFVDMSRALARPAHSAGVGTEQVTDSHAAHTNLDMLSTRLRSDHTLVNFAKNSRRHDAASAKAATFDQQEELVLSDADAILSKRMRVVALVDMRRQVARDCGQDPVRLTDNAFLDPTRDSATTRFLLRQQQQHTTS